MTRRKYDVSDGRIYTARRAYRRVVGTFVHPLRGLRIVYSVGGEANRECGYTQFRRWATANQAKRANPSREPRFSLRRAAA